MIELRIDPPAVAAEAARIVTVQLSNPGDRAYRNLIVALDVPPELGLEQGRSRVERSHLRPRETYEHALLLRPPRPGLFTIGVRNLSFRDGFGQSRRERGWSVRLEVNPAAESTAVPLPPPGEYRSRSGVRPSVFVSYRRSDSKMFVPGLVRDLGNRKSLRHVDFFLDLNDIPPSSYWPDVINRKLRECALFIAVIGPAWLSAGDDGGRRIDDPRDPVRRELSTALQRGVPVLPLLVDARLPNAADLPLDTRRLRARQCFTFDLARYSRSVQELSDDLSALLSAP
jgi:hypothetical protein